MSRRTNARCAATALAFGSGGGLAACGGDNKPIQALDWQPVAATTSRIKRWRRRKPRSENRRRFAEAGHGRRDNSQRDIHCALDNTKSTLDGIRQNTSDARGRLREVRSQDSQARSTLVKLQGKVSGVRSQIARNTFAGTGLRRRLRRGVGLRWLSKAG
jgi:hypothetical protein